MSVLKITGLCLVLALASTAAFGFQEQRSGDAGATAPAAEKSQVQDGANSQSGTVLKPSVGPDVRIPGLGKLGSLPKMDFGLELLYGAAEQKNQDVTPREDQRDELMIRGTVKHNF
jgi:hypothetical protein